MNPFRGVLLAGLVSIHFLMFGSSPTRDTRLCSLGYVWRTFQNIIMSIRDWSMMTCYRWTDEVLWAITILPIIDWFYAYINIMVNSLRLRMILTGNVFFALVSGSPTVHPSPSWWTSSHAWHTLPCASSGGQHERNPIIEEYCSLIGQYLSMK